MKNNKTILYIVAGLAVILLPMGLQVFGNEQRRVGVIAGEASSTRLPIGETQATDVPREHGFSVFPDGCLVRDTNKPNI